MKCCSHNNMHAENFYSVKNLESVRKCPSVKDEEGPRRCWWANGVSECINVEGQENKRKNNDVNLVTCFMYAIKL
jgi:hypothetical protein